MKTNISQENRKYSRETIIHSRGNTKYFSRRHDFVLGTAQTV
jgi:hypothetical protein